MDTETIVLILVASIAISLTITYYLIKGAVSAAMKRVDRNIQTLVDLAILDLKQHHSTDEISQALKKREMDSLQKMVNSGYMAKAEYDVKVRELNQEYNFH